MKMEIGDHSPEWLEIAGMILILVSSLLQWFLIPSLNNAATEREVMFARHNQDVLVELIVSETEQERERALKLYVVGEKMNDLTDSHYRKALSFFKPYTGVIFIIGSIFLVWSKLKIYRKNRKNNHGQA